MDHLEHLRSCTVCENADNCEHMLELAAFEVAMTEGDSEGVYNPDLTRLWLQELHAQEIVQAAQAENRKYYSSDPEGFDD